MNLMDIIQSQMSDELVAGLASQLGVNDKETTRNAAMGAATTLINALTKNASSSEGLQSLNGAVERDHDGSILNNVLEMVTGSGQTNNLINGAGILRHVLGGKQSGVIDVLANMTGLNKNSSANLMMQMAPLVLGALGKQKKQQGLDAQGLFNLLSSSKQEVQQRDNNASIFEKILDQDGDGNISDDMMGMGMKVLGSLFKR
jgi:hypothetical protein